MDTDYSYNVRAHSTPRQVFYEIAYTSVTRCSHPRNAVLLAKRIFEVKQNRFVIAGLQTRYSFGHVHIYIHAFFMIASLISFLGTPKQYRRQSQRYCLGRKLQVSYSFTYTKPWHKGLYSDLLSACQVDESVLSWQPNAYVISFFQASSDFNRPYVGNSSLYAW